MHYSFYFLESKVCLLYFFSILNARQEEKKKLWVSIWTKKEEMHKAQNHFSLQVSLTTLPRVNIDTLSYYNIETFIT